MLKGIEIIKDRLQRKRKQYIHQGEKIEIHTNMDDQDKDWLLIKKDDVFAATHVYDAKIIPSYDEVFL